MAGPSSRQIFCGCSHTQAITPAQYPLGRGGAHPRGRAPSAGRAPIPRLLPNFLTSRLTVKTRTVGVAITVTTTLTESDFVNLTV